MTNACEEFLKATKSVGVKVKCAVIIRRFEVNGVRTTQRFALKVGYTEMNAIVFLDNLEFDYDETATIPQIMGYIWLENGKVFTRGEYLSQWVLEDKSHPILPDLL